MKAINFTYLGTLVLSVSAALFVAGCASWEARQPSALEPRAFAEVRDATRPSASSPYKPVLALALGGGGLRGFAHLGVLRALQEEGTKRSGRPCRSSGHAWRSQRVVS